ncbi:ATP-grasp domain-containing protein [Kribbella sp. NPDC051620]|uniref:ATP-grasp domain-containing protein n=1 Tax=Kribbella sp. NPDC051620 TaxID=3364120 RepID=UPI0037B4B90D
MTSSEHTDMNIVDMSRQVAVVVDGYAMGKYLPTAFAAHGIDVVHVQSTPSWMKRLTPPDLGPYRANVPWTDEEDVAARLRQHRLIAVVPGIEPGVPAADRLSELLGLPTNGSALSAARRNKYLMIERLREAGLRCADQVLADSVDKVVAWARARDDYPVVVKPLTSASTDGVSICHNDDDVAQAAKDVLSSSTIFDAVNTHVLAQSFLEGDEYIVDTVSRDGRHYVCGVWRMDKIFLGPNKKIYGRDVLIDPDTELVARLDAYTRDVLDALGITHGPGHAEVMMTSQGPALVEIGARMDGHLHVDFHQRCLGHDQAQLTALAYADPERFIATYADGRYRKHQEAILFSAHSARTGHVEGLEPATVQEIENLPSLQLLTPLLRPGSTITPTVDQTVIPFRAYLAGDEWQQVEKDYLRIEELQDRLYRISDSAPGRPEQPS